MENPFSVRAALLQLLDRGDGRGSGVELGHRLRELTSISILSGSIYPALEQLVDDGLIAPIGMAYGEQGAPKKLYEITPAGREYAKAQRAIILLLFGAA